MPYTPRESLETLRYFHDQYGPFLWGPYGFYDAFTAVLTVLRFWRDELAGGRSWRPGFE
jgi:hypothetical protein